MKKKGIEDNTASTTVESDDMSLSSLDHETTVLSCPSDSYTLGMVCMQCADPKP